MKILFLSHGFAPRVGGIESHSRIMASALVEAGHEVCLVTLTGESSEAAFPFRVLRKPTVAELLRWHRWSDVLFENNPTLGLSLPNLIIRRPRVTVLHTWLAPPGAAVNRKAQLKRRWIAAADRVVSVSRALAAHVPSDRLTVVPNPYQNDLFRRRAEIPKTKLFVGLGRMVSDKGFHLALRAVRRLLNSKWGSTLDRYPTLLTLIGDGPQRTELEKESRSLGLADRVEFAGILRGSILSDTINAHRISVVPSIWEEPFGMVALETMACGCIPIVSASGGLPEAVGEAGLLFERGNAEDLADTMIALLADEERQRRLLARADDHLAAHTVERIGRRYLDLIESVVPGKVPADGTPNRKTTRKGVTA